MTDRERFRSILDWKTPDRTLWVPRLDIWYQARKNAGDLPSHLGGKSLEEIERYLGMVHSARKAAVFKKVNGHQVEEQYISQGDKVIHRYRTPVGNLAGIWHEPAANSGMARLLVQPYIREKQDYDVMRYIFENLEFHADYEAYAQYDRQVGDQGLPMVVLGESPIHAIMLTYVGYENFYYHLQDYPDKIQALLEVMENKYREMWDVVARSPAELVLHGTHFSSDMTPPPIFRKYFIPYFEAFNQCMHDSGKKVACHADADLTGLLEMVLACGFDVADTFACSPLVRTTFDEAFRIWRDKIVIWGGVPSVILEPDYPISGFQSYMAELLRKTRNQAGFIMAVSDNIMPPAALERLEWIRDLIS